jgi:uncharacterized protein (DUF488 family)
VASKIRLFTIGYEKRTISDYITLLKRSGVTLLADVRDHPHSRFKPDFGKARLSVSLPKAGIHYIHVEAAGNPKSIRMTADSLEDSLKQYKKYLTKNVQGVDELETLIKANSAVCLACYERQFKDCHRQHLVEALAKRMDLEIVHL